jgi:hypothetical protein
VVSSTTGAKENLMPRVVLALALLLALAGPGFADHHIISQGEFAAELMNAMWEWGTEWTPPDAVKFLTDHEVAPKGGWQPEAPLTRGVMMDVLNQVWGSYETSFPALQVSREEALGVLRSDRDQNRIYMQWKTNIEAAASATPGWTGRRG